ncbi:MAG: DNA polymerase III subunit gamma/tau [Candidatus Uhrbacteria bacterium]
MPVLYRKYRPQIFADVVGQEHVTRTLAAALAGGRVAHAYLFSGPRGVGKTTVARLMAKAVNCERRRLNDGDAPLERQKLRVPAKGGRASGAEGSHSKKGEDPISIPCNACDLCAEITEGRCFDVIEIDAASQTGVDNVREYVIEASRLAPARAACKVFIIDEVHMLSLSAFNALLKTLEEPPPHVLFVLATTEPHRVPETIRSRCQHFAFRRVDAAVIERRLVRLAEAEGVTIDANVLTALASASDGSVRDAETRLSQLIALGGKRVTAADAALVLPRSDIAGVCALIEAIEMADSHAALIVLRSAEEDGLDAEAFARDAILEIRKKIHPAPLLSEKWCGVHGTAANDAGGRCTAQTVRALRVFVELLDRIGRADRPFLLLEVAALGLIVEGIPVAPVATAVAERTRERPRAATSDRTGNNDYDDKNPMSGKGTTVGDAPMCTKNTHDGAVQAATVKSPSTATAVPLDALERIRSQWSALIERVGTAHQALRYLLESGRPQRVDGETLTIGFRFKLHAEKIREPQLAVCLGEAIAVIVGAPLRVIPAVIGADEFAVLDRAVRPPTGDPVADAALDVLGGEIVG